MAYQSLYRTWRPQTFSQMVGQEAIVRALKNQASSRRIAHAYLFCGSRGTGKTSAARIMAMAINCEQNQQGDPCLACSSCKALQGETTLDVFEMDAASNSRVEEIREMLARTDYPPQFVRYKVYIIDEVHMLSNAAFNALLKTLEEPPPYMVFILATTEPQKLPATILSRCQRFDFGRIAESEIVTRLKLALTEGLTAEEGALRLIAATAQGSMRDAWSLMDMCLGMGRDLSEDSVRFALGAVSQEFLLQLLDALIQGDTGAALSLTDQLMRSGRDVQVSLREFATHLRQVLSLKWTGKGITDLGAAQAELLGRQAKAAPASLLLFILEQCMLAEQDARWAITPRAVLELFVLRCTQLRNERDPAALLARIDQLEQQVADLSAGRPVEIQAASAAPGAKPASQAPVQQPAASIRESEAPEPTVSAEDIAAFTRSLPKEAPAAEKPKSIQDVPAAEEPLPPRQAAEPVHIQEPDPASESLEPEAAPDTQGPVDPPAIPEPADMPEIQAATGLQAQLPLAVEAAPEQPFSQPLAKSPKDAWNNMLKRLARENEGLYAMLHRGKYGGFLEDVFTLKLGKEDDILASLLSEESRSSQISSILSEEMGRPVRFLAGEPRPQVVLLQEEKPDEQLEALARVFGRDKINLKRHS